MEYRRATPADREQVVALCTAAMSDDWVPGAYDRLLAEPPPAGLYVIEEDGRIINCYHLRFVRPGEAYWSAMRVHPAVQGRGLGTRFCRLQLEASRRAGASRVLLLSEVGNRPAHRVVAKNGFVNQGEWHVWHRTAIPAAGGRPGAARPAVAADRAGVAAYLAARPLTGAARFIAAPGSVWGLQSLEAADFAGLLAAGQIALVPGRDGGPPDGLLVRELAGEPEGRVLRLRHLGGAAAAAAAQDLLALAAAEARSAGCRWFEAALPAVQAAALAGALPREARFAAYIFALTLA